MKAVRIVGAMLVGNALDLGSSLCLHGADQQSALPPKSDLLWVVQVALLGPLAYLAIRVAPACWRAMRALPAPLAIRLLIGAVMLAQLGHVMLRSEHYPFSAVTMFSDYVPPETYERGSRRVLFVVEQPRGTRPVSFLREGNPWFSEYLHADYKTGWLFGTHAQESAASRARVARLLESLSGHPARLVNFELDPHHGALTVVSQAHASAGL